MAKVYLGLGSNVEPKKHLQLGIRELGKQFGVLELSNIYQSAAVGFDGDDFLNLVARVQTHIEPLELKHMLNEFEDQHGRKRDVPKFSDRTVDIDILLYDERILDDAHMVLPRREITSFAHVLKPLADLAPDLLHPGNGESIADLWQAFPKMDLQLRQLKNFS